MHIQPVCASSKTVHCQAHDKGMYIALDVHSFYNTYFCRAIRLTVFLKNFRFRSQHDVQLSVERVVVSNSGFIT